MRRMWSVVLPIAALLLLTACENDVQRLGADVLITDTVVAGDTDTATGDDQSMTDTDTPVVTDTVVPDETMPDELAVDEEPLDETTIPDEDTVTGDACLDNGGVCVADPTCPNGYTPSQQFMCGAGLCCMPTGVSGLRIDVTGPAPVPGTLLAIPAVEPTPGEGGTGTPKITDDIAGPLIVIGFLEENLDGCKAFATPVTGTVVIVQRGNCTFSQKIENAATAGAIALIIYNNVPGDLGMNADGSIPTVGVTQAAGQSLLDFTKDHPDITVAIRP